MEMIISFKSRTHLTQLVDSFTVRYWMSQNKRSFNVREIALNAVGRCKSGHVQQSEKEGLG